MNVVPRCADRLLAILLTSAAAAAQSFGFSDFASTAPLSLNGAAAQVGTALRITNNGSAQTGSAWYTAPVRVTEGFETEFRFVLTTAPEGLAFVIQGSPAGAAALGGGLWGIGYGFGGSSSPISNSLAIEIDTIQDGFLNDTSGNEVSVHTVGALGNSENEGVSIARATPTVDLSNSLQHTVRVRYVPGLLEVFVDDLSVPLLSAPYTIENGGTQLSGGITGGLGLAGDDAWVGFTSATVSGTINHNAEIRSWTWTSFSVPPPCYEGNVHLGTGGPYDLLTIDGGNGGFFRTARLQLADPFTLAVAPPPGLTSAPFLLLATLGIADATTVTSTPFGNACFPLVAVVDLGGAVAPYSLPVPPGIFLPMELTLQAVMATDANDPNVIELTNAIALQFLVAPSPTITNVFPSSAPVGATITVNGDNFSLFATLDIGGTPVVPLTTAKKQITFAMPAMVACGSMLTVHNPDGGTATVGFNPTPTITNQVNSSGPAAGGTTYIVFGTGFATGTTATIGGNPATVTSTSATLVILSTPPGTPGPAQVVLTTPGGCSVTSTFTYL